ncbi:hypothetical protein ACQPW1_06870 [Nocardia sp. CA-128927]|uniref:hypothetical protein n=1 Tax=Nocardia sp. CA-128927 TaxID=3239975 RepID=UPI003D99A3EB
MVALHTRYPESHQGFTLWSRQQMCGDPGFGEHVKEVAVARKGKLKACCATEKGLADFFARKLQALIDLQEREEAGDDPYDTLWKCDEYQGECQSGR